MNRPVILAALAAALPVQSACAGGPGALSIPWWTIDCGGGTSTAGALTLSGTFGQPDASTVLSGGSLRLIGGFWPAFAVTPCGPADIGSTGGVEGADGVLDNNDFVVYINHFFAHDPAADIGVTGGVPGSDGAWDNNDFIVYIDQFFTGCV